MQKLLRDFEAETFSVTGKELLSVLKDLEVMLQSLHRVGSYYAERELDGCDGETIRIIDGFRYAQRLSRVRSILLKSARSSFGSEEFEIVEDSLGRVRHWRKPGDV